MTALGDLPCLKTLYVDLSQTEGIVSRDIAHVLRSQSLEHLGLRMRACGLVDKGQHALWNECVVSPTSLT